MVRFKNRYVVMECLFLELPPEKDLKAISPHHILNQIRDSVVDNYGDCGYGCTAASLQGRIDKESPHVLVKYWNPMTRIFILRCSRDYADVVRTSSVFVRSLCKSECMFKTIYYGGSQSLPSE